MEYTNGPWFVDQFGHVYGWTKTVETAGATEKDSVCLLDGRHSKATSADKILIAHAPELLEALEAATAHLQRFCAWNHPEEARLATDCRTAIRRARGEA